MKWAPESAMALTHAHANAQAFPPIDERVEQSIERWADDLRALFDHARDRFADVSWESSDAAGNPTSAGDRVWAHKAVVYVRAPKAFKDRYFVTTARSRAISRSPTSLSGAAPASTSTPYLAATGSMRGTPSPHGWRGAASSLSVDTAGSDGTLRPPTVSLAGSASDGGVLRLRHDDPPELFRAQLEWLYTGEGFGDVVEWITEERPASGRGRVRDSLGRRGNLADRRDKLGQDLTYMWTSKLYCDVRIHLAAPDGEGYSSDSSGATDDSLSSTVIFTAHRFMLVSRSPYFASLLLNPNDFRPATADVHLPPHPFTPAALHFCLGWMYAGHLDFSNRSYDLLTAFQIYRAAEYLQLDCLVAEVESRIVHDFCHGLDYDKCHCRRCLGRVPRVWRFAGASDVGALELQRRARRFVVSGWGDTLDREIALADKSERDDLVSDVLSSLTPTRVVSAFRGVAHVRRRMDHWKITRGREARPWIDALTEMIEPVERRARVLLASNLTQVCESKELWDMLGGKAFSDETVDTFLAEVVDMAGRSPTYTEAPRIYQTLVSALLLKVQPGTHDPALPMRSANRAKVEAAKAGVLKHIKKRWMSIQSEGGFTGLESWSIKEICHEIEVPVEDVGASSPVPFPSARDSNGFSRSSRPGPLSDAHRAYPKRASGGVASPETPTEHSGLRRLRLTSAASVSSVASARSAAERTAARGPTGSGRPTPPARPQARSPTAAEKTPLVSVGAKNRSSLRSGPTSPTPSRPAQLMSGPPRPLLTGSGRMSRTQRADSGSTASSSSPIATTTTDSGAAAADPLSPTSPTESSASTHRRDGSLSSMRSVSSAVSNGTAITAATARSTASNATTRTRPTKPVAKAAGASSTSTAAASVASKAPKATGAAAKAAGTVAKTTSPATKPAGAAGPAKAPVRSTEGASKPAARPRTLSSASTASTAAARTRTTSTTSVRSRAPSVAPSVRERTLSSTSQKSPAATSKAGPSKPVNGRAAAASKDKVPPVPKMPAKVGARPAPLTKPATAATTTSRPGTLRPSTSSKSISSRSSAARASPVPPKTPTTKAPAPKTAPNTPGSTKSLGVNTPTRTRATSLNPKATPPNVSARQRTTSGAGSSQGTPAAPWKRATPLPPSVAGVRGHPQPATRQHSPRQPSSAPSRPSTRSLSGSTEGPQEAITPRVSEISEPAIVVDADSDIDDTTPPAEPQHVQKDLYCSPEIVVDDAEVKAPTPKTEKLDASTDSDPTPKLDPPHTLDPPHALQPASQAPQDVTQPEPQPAPTAPAAPVIPPRTSSALSAAAPPALSTTAPPAPSTPATAPAELPAAPTRSPPLVPPSTSTPMRTPTQPLRASFDSTSPASRLGPSTSPASRLGTSAPGATTPIRSSPRSARSSVYSSGTAPSPKGGVITRVPSDSGSLRGLNSGWHPALMFDPPKRAPSTPPAPPPASASSVPSAPKIQVTDDNIPFSGVGVALHVGIPCIVTLSGRRARFRANVKYLGRMAGAGGAWVGLEVDDLEPRLGIETLPTGAVDGVRYFHFTPPAADRDGADERAARARRLAIITDEIAARARGEHPRPRPSRVPSTGLLGMPPLPAGRAASPYAIPEWGPPEKPRAMFVRPDEVLFVMGSD